MKEEPHPSNRTASYYQPLFGSNNSSDAEKVFMDDLLECCQRKPSAIQTEINMFEKDQCQFQHCSLEDCPNHQCRSFNFRKTKFIDKRFKDKQQTRTQSKWKKRVKELEDRVEQLQRQILHLKRNEFQCPVCSNQMLMRQQVIMREETIINGAGQFEVKKNSKDSLQFEKIQFHVPLMNTREMSEKMWIFVGTLLIAMGSKVMEFDGSVNKFKFSKRSLDKVRRQVQKSDTSVGLEFFYSRSTTKTESYTDDYFDPFLNSMEECHNHLNLDNLTLQSIEDKELLYDSKYHFQMNYESLLTIMEYARDNCSIW